MSDTTRILSSPAGEHVGVYSALATMGLQPSDYGARPNVYVEWQVTCPDGSIRTVGKRYYNLSLHPSANFRQDLEALIGRRLSADEARKFDIRTLIGRPCLLTIEHREDSKGVTRANVASIALPPPGVSPQLVGEPLLFDVNNRDNAALDRLPAWIQQAIKNPAPAPVTKAKPTDGRSAAAVAAARGAEFDDEIPF